MERLSPRPTISSLPYRHPISHPTGSTRLDRIVRSTTSDTVGPTNTASASTSSSSRSSTSNMHSILQLHYQIQRRSVWEKWLTYGSLVGLAIFTTATYVSYRHIEQLEQYSSLTHPRPRPTLQRTVTREAPLGAKQPPQQLTPNQRHNRHLTFSPHLLSEPSLREQFVAQHVEATPAVMSHHIDEWRHPDPHTFLHPSIYDIWNCPTDHVPTHYPYAWLALDVLSHWNPDVTQAIPESTLHQSLCVFDWRNTSHRAAVDLYQAAEVPFVLRQHDTVVATAYRWSTPHYLSSLLQHVPRQRNEHSTNNHFMFWRLPPKRLSMREGPQGFVPPTDNVELTFAEWSERAERLVNATDAQQVHADHWYFRLNAGLPKTNVFLYDELPMFQPTFDEPTEDTHSMPHPARNVFMVDSSQQRGINCRFGMRGVIAEAHFDPTRNWILVLSGQRRYILAHPDQCRHLELYPKGHPSGRHSSIDWSTIAQKSDNSSGSYTYTYTGPFAQARVQEVVLQGGDALYLPTSWFHFIVSLSTNYQCNARSGETLEHRDAMKQCGFDLADKKYHAQPPAGAV